MALAIHDLKQLIIRLYRNIDPRELEGLYQAAEGQYMTGDRKWTYFVRHGGFIERQNNHEAELSPVPIFELRP